ncbi:MULTISPECIES: hypothetical protein [unclassified Shewanella]|nr:MULTISPECIES: hypothetical protein [unclassified Shewanella]
MQQSSFKFEIEVELTTALEGDVVIWSDTGIGARSLNDEALV